MFNGNPRKPVMFRLNEKVFHCVRRKPAMLPPTRPKVAMFRPTRNNEIIFDSVRRKPAMKDSTEGKFARRKPIMIRPTRPKLAKLAVSIDSTEGNIVRLCLTQASYGSKDSTQSGYVLTDWTE